MIIIKHKSIYNKINARPLMINGLEKLLEGVQTVAVICNQWGDSGKGKIVHCLSEWADIIARGTGGNNAGHTIIINGQEKIFHLIPSGIVYDDLGKRNFLGNGMVIDIGVFCEELNELDAENMSYDNLLISKDAHVIMPYHKNRDVAKYKSLDGIGSTGRGIGPCYEDKIGRRGVSIGELFDKDKLAAKIKGAKQFYPEQNIEVGEIMDSLSRDSIRIKRFVANTIQEMHTAMKNGKKILLEGAQGLLLSIE